MKKHYSVFKLYMKSNLFKILMISVIAAILDISYFLWQSSVLGDSCVAFNRITDGLFFNGGSGFVTISIPEIVFIVAFIACLALLGGSGQKVSKYSYTILRLRISEREVFLVQCLPALICISIFYLSQIAVFCGAARIWADSRADISGPLNPFLDFSRSPFLRGLIPMADGGLWLRNFCYLLLVAVFSAMTQQYIRTPGDIKPLRAHMDVAMVALFGYTLAVRFRVDSVTYRYFMGFVALFLAVVLLLLNFYVVAHDGKVRENRFDD